MRRGLAVFALACTAVPAAATAQEADLPEPVTMMLQKAAERDAREKTSRYLDTAVVLVADSYPDRRQAVLNTAQRLAPARAAELAALLPEPGTPEAVAQKQEEQKKPKEEKKVSADAKSPPPQSKAEKKAAPPKPAGFFSFDGWDGSIELGAGLLTGNVSTKSVASAISLLNDRRYWRHKVGAQFSLIKTDGITTNERAAASYQLDYKFSERLYAFGQFQYEYDRFAAFRERYLEAIGVGYRVLEGETYSLDVEGSAAVRQGTVAETMQWQTEYGGRLNTIFNWNISDNFAINNTGSAFITDQRTTLENTIALKTKITETISGKLSFNVKHDTDVPLDSVQTSTETKATLLYNF
jgi:putative salt-induced outer membrane protein